MIRSVVRAAVLLLAAPLVPVLASVAPAGAEAQPCRVTYSSPGGTIKADTADQPTDAWDKHALSAFDIRVADARLVTDVDVVWDLTHADASQVTLHVLGPKTGSSGFPPLVPSIQTYNTGMASGPLNGRFSFDDEAATTKLVGASPASGVYLPATPATNLEQYPANGTWSLWVLNQAPYAAALRSWSLTLTYATCDTDGDGVEDKTDNCTSVVNADQTNRDDDALGDACDLDLDGDGIGNGTDGCTQVAASTASGCPQVGRTASLRFTKATRKLKTVVRSDAPGCAAQATVTLYRAKRGKDRKLVVGTTNDKGRWTTKAPRTGGRHYVRVAASDAAGEAECGATRSKKERVKRGRTSPRALLTDTDGDGLDDTRDGCATVAAATSTGCPIRPRSVRLTWLAGKQRLQVQVTSPEAACAQRARIAVFRVRPNNDYKVLGGSVSFSGRLRVKVARGATYYVTVPTSYASGVAECGAATSRKVAAPRG